MNKPPLPVFATDEEAEAFVDTADLTQFDLSGAIPTRYEFAAKSANISMRVPQGLLDAVKAAALQDGMPYQRYIRRALERAIQNSK